MKNKNDYVVENLSSSDRNLLVKNGQLEQTHMMFFNSILQEYTPYSFQAVGLYDYADLIKPACVDEDCIQILHSQNPDHWVCCYYDSNTVFIYDSLLSLRNGKLTNEERVYLKHLFPHIDISTVKFPKVQQQPSGVDCGVFAIAFAVSLVFRIRPEKVHYEHCLMRNHLLTMYDNRKIEHFPQDVNFTLQNVVPLALALQRRNCSLLARSYRRSKTTAASKKTLAQVEKMKTTQFEKPTLKQTKESNISVSNTQKDIIADSQKVKLSKLYDSNPISRAQSTGNAVTQKRQREYTWQGLRKLQMHNLRNIDKKAILDNKCLSNDHMFVFNSIVQNLTSYLPYDVLCVQKPEKIKPVPPNKNHIQILHSPGHWVCSYYDSNDNCVYIYDSMNKRSLVNEERLFLQKLYPNFSEKNVVFPKVQAQVNTVDCGVFAIAFAVSILCGIKPETVKYDSKLMRTHLMKILTNHSLEHFPLQNGKEMLFPNVCETSISYLKNNSSNVHLHEFLNDDLIISEKLHKNDEQGSKTISSDLLLQSPAVSDTVIPYERGTKRKLYCDNEKSNDKVKRKKIVVSSSLPISKKNNKDCSIKHEGKSLTKSKFSNAINRQDICQKKKSNASRAKALLKCPSLQNLVNKNKTLKSFGKISVQNKKYVAIATTNTGGKIKLFASSRVVKKYKTLSSMNTLKVQQCKEVYIRKLSNKLSVSAIERRMEAENIVKLCLNGRKNTMHFLAKTIRTLKTMIEVILAKLKILDSTTHIKTKIEALCGLSRHNASTESYFAHVSYKFDSFLGCQEKFNSDYLMMNQFGQVMNILPLVPHNKASRKTWECNPLICNIYDIHVVQKYEALLSLLNTCTLKNIRFRIKNIEQCSAIYSNLTKLGHPSSCYENCNKCVSKFISALILAPHFPSVRYIVKLVYKMKELVKNIDMLDKALYETDVDYLKSYYRNIKENLKIFEQEVIECDLNEERIRISYPEAFKAYTKRSMDTAIYPCISCEKLHFKKGVIHMERIRKPIVTVAWNDFIKYLKDENLQGDFICRYCVTKFRENKIPSSCVLNNLVVHSQPREISSLNEYEKILIQRAKAFQVVQRMGTVANKKLPNNRMIQKVKGRTFHLPLPIDETLKKICPTDQAVNKNHELHILVRGIPNKSKVIWEQLVDVRKVFVALTWLKNNNPEYKDIMLPQNCNDLLNNLKDTEFFLEYDELRNANEQGNICDEEDQHVEETEHVNVKNNKQTSNAKDYISVLKAGLLTQKSQSDDYYDQFTICCINDKRVNSTSTALYQMLKVNERPLDNRLKILDVLCFPDLYPYGINGQHEKRNIRLTDFEYIKLRLMSKHSQFRLNIQYLFYLLNDNNIRQLKAGIYHKMNITNPRQQYTAATYLDLLSKELLESDLNTIFSRLRNTEQYWKIPRSDLNCMVYHYGPATWFLTLSPAEWLWPDLVHYIREVNGGRMDKLSAGALIAADPVSVSRFMENKFNAMLDFILSSDNPLGKVTNYFWRREYQGRGTQHWHLLLWVKDAPILGESTNVEVAEFIIKYVTCRCPDKKISPTLFDRVMRHQRHVHNAYCLRNKKTKRGFVRCCRFEFPRLKTNNIILRDAVTSIAGRKTLKSRSRLYDLPRSCKESFINDYNPAILTVWEGNMDIQFIGEKSRALTHYITKYETKAEKSHTTETFEDIKSTKPLCTQLWNFSLRVLNHRECGALEAADTLLGIHLYGTDSNTTIRWLNVNEIRSKKLKSHEQIERLQGDSTDLFCKNLADDYYPQRPVELDSFCLYDFAKEFDIVKEKPKTPSTEYYQLSQQLFIQKRRRHYLINHYRYNPETQPEKYYFALLFLFKPWRKIEELKNGYASYAEAFGSSMSSIERAVRYHEKMTEIREVFKKVEDLIKQEVDKNEDSQNNNGTLECNPVEADEAMKDFKDMDDNIEAVDLAESITLLNKDQKRIFDRVTDSLKSNLDILRLYVSGEGGTGKSFLIHTIRSWVKQDLQKRVVVTAPTGIAAFSIQGMTIHRLFQLPIEHGKTPKYYQLSDSALQTLRADLQNVALIIIDEISMISNITFMYIHLRLSEIFDTMDSENGWFGKIPILLFGDLLQLPPVRENPAYVELSVDEIAKYIGAMGSFHLWELFSYDELSINMRQKNDVSYRDMLSRIRMGLVTTSDRKTLQSKKIQFSTSTCHERLLEMCNFIKQLPVETICLFPTRKMCEVFNTKMLEKISSDEIILTAHDSIDCPRYLKAKVAKALKTDDEDCSRSGGLPQVIVVKLGAKIMITRNIDVTLGLVNGAIAMIKSISTNVYDKNDIENITVLLPSGSDHVIERVNVKFEIIEKAFVIRKQFPITLSYAITVHKSQGLSLKEAVIDAGNSMFAEGQIYVALSRVMSLEGLHLINFDPSSVKANTQAIIEYNRLRKKYRADLPIMQTHVNRISKVVDDHWTGYLGVISCEITPQQGNTIKLPVRGLRNVDAVSCYANSVVQCILYCTVLKRHLINLPKENVFHILVKQYENINQNVDIFGIRRFVGENYGQQQQQDAAQFLADLCNMIDSLRNALLYKVKYTRICALDSCKEITKTEEEKLFVHLPIPKKRKIDSLQELINDCLKMEKVQAKCNKCGHDYKFCKTEFSSLGTITILQLLLFDGMNKIIDLNINRLPHNIYKIGGNSYRVIATIFHKGETTHQGHYNCMLKENEHWVCVDDMQVYKKRWPKNAKEAYIFFLDKQK